MPSPSKHLVANYGQAAQKAAATIRKQKKEIKLTPRIKKAIELMVYEGWKRPEAAELVDLSDHAVRAALTKPHVLAYLNQCQDVLRTSLRPRALHTMGELLDAKTDTIKFKAAEYLDGMNRGGHTMGAQQINVNVQNNVSVETPGYVIKLARKDTKQIDHLATDADNDIVSLDDVPNDE